MVLSLSCSDTQESTFTLSHTLTHPSPSISCLHFAVATSVVVQMADAATSPLQLTLFSLPLLFLDFFKDLHQLCKVSSIKVHTSASSFKCFIRRKHKNSLVLNYSN